MSRTVSRTVRLSSTIKMRVWSVTTTSENSDFHTLLNTGQIILYRCWHCKLSCQKTVKFIITYPQPMINFDQNIDGNLHQYKALARNHRIWVIVWETWGRHGQSLTHVKLNAGIETH